jgi:hypothetical protein
MLYLGKLFFCYGYRHSIRNSSSMFREYFAQSYSFVEKTVLLCSLCPWLTLQFYCLPDQVLNDLMIVMFFLLFL